MTFTTAITCDFCGKAYGISAQKIPAGDLPIIDLPRPTIFGMDACEECAEKAKLAVKAVLRPPIGLVVVN